MAASRALQPGQVGLTLKERMGRRIGHGWEDVNQKTVNGYEISLVGRQLDRFEPFELVGHLWRFLLKSITKCLQCCDLAIWPIS
jgi:hypothetical protein